MTRPGRSKRTHAGLGKNTTPNPSAEAEARAANKAKESREDKDRRPDIFPVGEVLSDTYEIRGVLGAGGMGQVFDAYDVVLSRRVAIKALWPSLHAFSLRKEAQGLAAVRHPSLVTVYAMWKHRDVEYLVMEHVPGVTLEDHLADRKAKTFGLDEALDILIAIADGLAAVHSAGIAHRDVKPANVILAPGNRVVMTDFGLVLPEFEMAKIGAFAGTPAYMSPEAIQSKVAPGAGNLVDAYAFGILAFELISGRLPFEAEKSMKMMQLHINAPVPDLAVVAASTRVPSRLAALVAELMAKDPRERPQLMEAVAGQLRAIRAAGAAPTSGAPMAKMPANEQPATESGPAVLVVDDMPDIAKLIAMYVKLASPRAEVTVVHGAKEAIASIRKRAPALMIMDLMMPGMSGVELVMYLRGERIAEETAVVAVSGGGNDADIQLLEDLGLAHFVPKGADLRARITAIVHEMAL